MELAGQLGDLAAGHGEHGSGGQGADLVHLKYPANLHFVRTLLRSHGELERYRGTCRRGP